MQFSADLLARVRAGSPFLSTLIDREADFLDRIAGFDVDVQAAVAAGGDMPLAQQLRIERPRVALLVALGDLAASMT